MFGVFIRKLQRGLSVLAAIRGPDPCNFSDDEELEMEVPLTKVPEDVKEGHFAVFAVKGTEKKRFVVELGYLSSPAFLSLLEQAKEVYGFRQKGVLAVPCRPEELQKILQDRKEMRDGGKSRPIKCNPSWRDRRQKKTVFVFSLG